MPEIAIAPASADRFEDVQHALTGGGDGRSCQCQWWTMTSAQFNATTRDERAGLLDEELTAATPTPLLIVTVDGEPAGIVRVGPRTEQIRLARTREFMTAATQPWEDPSVWAVTCFVVRREHRGMRLMGRLLDAAVDHARRHGARLLEAYPIDATARPARTNDLFRGTLSTFEDAGFVVIARPKPHTAIVVRRLASP